MNGHFLNGIMDVESFDSSDLRSDSELYCDDEEEEKKTPPLKSRSSLTIKKTFNKPPLFSNIPPV